MQNERDIDYPMAVQPCASLRPGNQLAGLPPAFRTLRHTPEVSPQGDEGVGDYVIFDGAWTKLFTKHREPHGSAASLEPHNVAGTKR